MNAKKTIVLGFVLVMLAAAVSADIRIESVSMNPAHIEPGDEVTVYVKVYKAPDKQDVFGGTEREGSKGVVKDDPSIFYMGQILAKDDASRQYITILDGQKKIGHLFYGESWTTPFKIRVRADAPAGDYALEYRLLETDSEYTTTKGIKAYDVNVPVEGLVKFSISSKAQLSLGGTGVLEISLDNVGGGNARQISVKLNATSPFTILSSSEAYAGNMVGLSSRNLSYSISVASDAKPGAYEIPLEIKYVNSTGSEVTVKKTIGVEVTGEPDISVMLEGSAPLKKGGSGKVTLTVINNGFIDAKFVNIEVVPSTGYSVGAPSSVYIGNLASDDFENQDFTVSVRDDAPEGMLPLRAVVEYRKENSNKIERLDATVNVDILSEDEYATTVKANGGSSSALSMVLAIPALVVAYIVLWLVVKFVGVATTYLNRRLFKRGGQ